MGRILAIDYGQKRVGLAVTDELQIIATPLGTIPSSDIMKFLNEYVGRNPVDCFIVGEALQMNNTPSESSRFIEPFVLRLQKEFVNIPVKRIDERFTSLIAARSIRDAGMKRKDRQNKALVDTVSAVLILQSYLESRNLN